MSRTADALSLVDSALEEADEIPSGPGACAGAKRGLLMLGEARRALLGANRDAAYEPRRSALPAATRTALTRLQAAEDTIWNRVDRVCGCTSRTLNGTRRRRRGGR